MLKWYLDHGLKITAVHQTINCFTNIFTWFVNKVTENRHKGDQNPEQELLAEVFQLLCNSSYGKLIKSLKQQITMNCTKSESTLRKDQQSVWFQNLEEIGNVYKIEKRKCQVEIDRPFLVGIAVYQMAKLWVLQFYYDFLDKFVHRWDYEFIQMDTDSLYFGLSCDSVEEAVQGRGSASLKSELK